MRPGISGIPNETLEEIFQHIPIPDYLLYPNFHPGRDSLWCQNIRTKKATLLVCKQWNSVALPLLYRNIAINNFGALVRLSKTIEDNPTRIGTLVRGLSLVYIIPKPFYDLMSFSLDLIVKSCPNLRRIAYEHDYVPEYFHKVTPMLLIPYCAEQLTLGGSCSVRKYLFPGLVSFITHLTIQMGTFDFNENETITLPNVHTLVIDTEGFGRMDHLHSFCQHIDLPCLRNLEFSARVPNFLNACIALCERHSRKIKSLRIGPDPYYNPRGLSVSRKPTIEACSSLVDLSIDFFTEHASHPTLTRLDIIYPFPAEDETTFPLELPMKWDFPSVQQIRVISLDLSRLQGLQDNLPWTIDGDRVLLYDICVCRIKVGKNDALLVHPKVEHDLAQTELRWRSRHGDGDGGVIDENAPADGTAAGDNMATLEGEDRPEASRDSSDSSSDFTWSPGSSDDSESDSEEEAEIDYEELRGEFDWSLDRQEMLEIFHEISGREYGDIYLPSDHAHDRGEDELEDHTSDVEVRQSVYIRRTVSLPVLTRPGARVYAW